MEEKEDSKFCSLSCLWSLLVLGGIGYGLFWFVKSTYVTGYSSYNTQVAYPILSFPHLVSMLGGLHYYDIIIPFACFSYYVWWLYSRKNKLEEEDDSNDSLNNEEDSKDKYYWMLWKAFAGLLMLCMPLRLIYGGLFLINSLSITSEQTIVTDIVLTHEYEHYRKWGESYTLCVLIVKVDDGVPYELITSERNYQLAKYGKVKRVKLFIEKGWLGFSRVKTYVLIE